MDLLMDELVEEFLLRLPPDDPASLVRAALVCKRWRRLVSSRGFRRQFRELHRAPPMLGFLYQLETDTDFVPASSFRPPHAFREDWRVVDARHGRVLAMIWCSSYMKTEFVVWDPITDDVRNFPAPTALYSSWSAALLCAAVGCDHLDCPGGGPFLVVLVGTNNSVDRHTRACVYSSEQGVWSKPISVHHQTDCIMRVHRALVGNALYFNYELNTRILEYDLSKHELSIIDLPSAFRRWHVVFMEADDGGLGFATVQESKLCLWSREAGSNDGYGGWAQRIVIDLDKLLPIPDRNLSVSPSMFITTARPPHVVAVADSVGVIFMWTGAGLFTVHLKSGQIKKVGDYIPNFGIVPYMSFYTPALGLASTADEGPQGDASTSNSQT